MTTSDQTDIIEHWDERASNYLRSSRQDFARRSAANRWKDLLSRTIGTSKPLHILDIGCGPGNMTRLLLEMGHRVTAVDISRKMLGKARHTLITPATAVSFCCAEASRLPFPDNSFDVVVSRYLVWTLIDPAGALLEWQRINKPGGFVVIIDGNWYRYHRTRHPAHWWTSCMNLLYRIWTGHRSGNDLAADYALDLPCSRVSRPRWDIAIMSDLGYIDICVNRNVERQIWGIVSAKRLKYLGSHQFVISGRKPE